MTDGLLTRPEGFGAINHLDYREWLLQHGIDPAALDSAILRGMYDLVFAYEAGDPARPRFSAGLGLDLATRMLLGYSGALFWKMQAGMGEVIFAPLFEVLRRRGVEFRFFHRVDALRLDDDGRSIAAIDLGIQAEVAAGAHAYDPLIRVKGLPCWPDAPLASQLRSPDCLDGVDLESVWSPRRDVGRCTLQAGRDFDTVVFAISLGMVPHVCGELLDGFSGLAVDGRQRRNGRHTGLSALVVRRRRDARLARALWGHRQWFRFAVRHLGVNVASPARRGLARDKQPRTIAYFCSVLDTSTPRERRLRHPERDHRRCENGRERSWNAMWRRCGRPPSTTADSAGPSSATAPPAAKHGHERLDSQYVRANVDPSDRYVQSLPGTDAVPIATGRHRLQQPRRGGRLDRQWLERRVCGGCHPIGATGRGGSMRVPVLVPRTWAGGERPKGRTVCSWCG